MIVELGQVMTGLNKTEGYTDEHADRGTVTDVVQMIAWMVFKSQSRTTHQGPGQSAVKSIFEDHLKTVFLRSNPPRVHPTDKAYEKQQRDQLPHQTLLVHIEMVIRERLVDLSVTA